MIEAMLAALPAPRGGDRRRALRDARGHRPQGQLGLPGAGARPRGAFEPDPHRRLGGDGRGAAGRLDGRARWPRTAPDAPAERLRPALHHAARRADRGRHRQQHHRARLRASPARSACLPGRDRRPTGRRACCAEAARREAATAARSHPDAAIRFDDAHGAAGLPAPSPTARPSGWRARSPATTAATSSPTRPRPGTSRTRGLSTVVCGPGSIAQAHQPDEFITARSARCRHGVRAPPDPPPRRLKGPPMPVVNRFADLAPDHRRVAPRHPRASRAPVRHPPHQRAGRREAARLRLRRGGDRHRAHRRRRGHPRPRAAARAGSIGLRADMDALPMSEATGLP